MKGILKPRHSPTSGSSLPLGFYESVDRSKYLNRGFMLMPDIDGNAIRRTLLEMIGILITLAIDIVVE